jgi:hypothetical protein
MGETQRVLIAKQMREEHHQTVKRRKRLEKLKIEAAWGIALVIFVCCFMTMMMVVVEDRIRKYPHLGDGWIPTTPEERAEAARPKIYTGR